MSIMEHEIVFRLENTTVHIFMIINYFYFTQFK